MWMYYLILSNDIGMDYYKVVKKKLTVKNIIEYFKSEIGKRFGWYGLKIKFKEKR